MVLPKLPVGQIICGNCIEILSALPEKSVDVIFADPPYNLQLQNDLWRPNFTKVDGVDDSWDRFENFEEYDAFCRAWLKGCQRVLKDNGTIWVIGTYHNIFRIGAIMQDLGYWFLNDIIWVKTNPMPNFRGVRFTNAHETLIWACKNKGARYTFNHHAMKKLNEGKQMRSDWHLPICTGKKRIKINGKKAHSTQKPEALLERVILSSSNPGDIILDPFFGSGTTGAVAKRLHRNWIGIEGEPDYVEIAKKRIDAVSPTPHNERISDNRDKKRTAARIPFMRLLETGLLQPGSTLYFRRDRNCSAVVNNDGKLQLNDFTGSIHQTGRHLMKGGPCNGWEHWYYEKEDGQLETLDHLRQIIRKNMQTNSNA